MAVSARRRWLRQLVEHTSSFQSADVVAAVAARVVDGQLHTSGDLSALLDSVDAPPGGWDDPWLIGAVHERLASVGERSDRGAWYTPPDVVTTIVTMALPLAPSGASAPAFVVDPTCGGGGFLLAALDRLVELGLSPADALGRVGGLDIDAGAVDACRLSLAAWGTLAGASSEAISVATGRVEVGDQLQGWPAGWPPVDLVLGNPPFATPLRGSPFPEAAVAARLERSDRLGPYADLAAIHLAVCVERVEPGGRVAMLLPQSLLAGRDTTELRQWIDDTAPMLDIWATKDAVFDASVRVWAPLLVRHATGAGAEAAAEAEVAAGAEVAADAEAAAGGAPGERAASAVGSWSVAAAQAIGVPVVSFGTGATLGSILRTATAGFRDEFYALADACVELADVADADAVDLDAAGAVEVPDGYMRLATVGSLDPLVSWWGERPTKFAKRSWHQPVIDIGAIDSSSAAWLAQMQTSKVLLPTQSRIFEPVVDRHGVIAPATPLLALLADLEVVDHIAAVFLAPPVTAWAFSRWFGSAMSVEAIKVAARDLAEFPLPTDKGAWDEAAALVAGADGLAIADGLQRSIEVGRIMNRAYGGSDEVEAWWLSRATALLPSAE